MTKSQGVDKAWVSYSLQGFSQPRLGTEPHLSASKVEFQPGADVGFGWQHRVQDGWVSSGAKVWQHQRVRNDSPVVLSGEEEKGAGAFSALPP